MTLGGECFFLQMWASSLFCRRIDDPQYEEFTLRASFVLSNTCRRSQDKGCDSKVGPRGRSQATTKWKGVKPATLVFESRQCLSEHTCNQNDVTHSDAQADGVVWGSLTVLPGRDASVGRLGRKLWGTGVRCRHKS